MHTPSRRTLLAGAGAVGLTAALSGCAAYGVEDPSAGNDPNANAAAGGNGSTNGAGSTNGNGTAAGNGAPDGNAPRPANAAAGFAKVGDIPVGGGKIFADQKIVVTQPTAGTFRCFTAVCTHAGCVVGEVSDGMINCPCHGSKFKVADGSVANGPAKKPLSEVNIKVNGDSISKA